MRSSSSLPRPKHCPRIDCRSSLNYFVLYDDAGGVSQLVKFGHRLFGIGYRPGRHADEDRPIFESVLPRHATIARHLLLQRLDQRQKIDIKLRSRLWRQECIRLMLVSSLQVHRSHRQQVGRTDQTRQTIVRVDVDGDHQIESQKRKVGEIVLS